MLKEFRKLSIQTKNIRDKLVKLQKQEALSKIKYEQKIKKKVINNNQLSIVHDCNGKHIKKGDTVEILTKGKYDITHGIVTKISESKKRVSIINSKQIEVVRAPHNLCVVDN